MPYHPATDTYTCSARSVFKRIYDTKRKSKSGYEAKVTVYECSSCSACPQKTLCTRAKGNRRLQVSKDFLSLRQASLERITTDWGKMLRLNRSIQAEGAFGVLIEDFGFRRFLRRGEGNVFTEVLLYAMAYNVNKLHNKMRQNQSVAQYTYSIPLNFCTIAYGFAFKWQIETGRIISCDLNSLPFTFLQWYLLNLRKY